MARWLASRGRPHAKRQPPGPRPTLGELQRSHCWTWVYCEKCLHHAPMALVPLIVRWGAEDSSDQLRQCARCTKCGHTVMFSDLVGSTAMSARMDAEDLREVISAYQKCVTETVQRFGGFVAKYMGDGVLVYFGYPQAHEDDAERAVRAGLELVAAVTSLKTHSSLQTRVGIATGLVVGSAT
jgi:class 3 adenylate cyclase